MSGLQEILQDGFMGNLPNPSSLQAIARLSQSEAAAYCFVSPETYRRWKADRKPPQIALRLLSLRAGYCPWPGWEKYFYCQFDGLMYHTDLKYGFRPGDLPRLYWLEQEVIELRKEREGLIREARQERERVLQSDDTSPPIEIQKVSDYLPNEGQKAPRFYWAIYFAFDLTRYMTSPRGTAATRRVPFGPDITKSYENSIHYA